jgi:tight adherence protein C
MILAWAAKVAALGLAFAALLLAVNGLASAPGTKPNYLGLRGLKRVRALETNPVWQQLEPTVRWLGVQLAPLLPEKRRQRLDAQLTCAGDLWGLQPEEFVALSVLTSLLGLSGGALYGLGLDRGSIYVVMGPVLGAAWPYVYLSSREEERRRRVQKGLPYVIDLLALGLSAGLDFPGALRQVVDKSSSPDDPLVEELNIVLQELQVGKTRKQALLQFAGRVPTDSVREFVGAVVQAEERGNPLGNVLQIQAETSRQRRAVRAEEVASKAGLKMILPALLLLCSVMLLIMGPLVMDLENVFGD